MLNSMDSNKKNEENRKFYERNTYDVFVGHVPKTLQKGKIEQVFSKYGVLVDVLYRFGNGSYGYVIVKFKYQKDADAVLMNVDKINIGGYDMEVKKGKMNNQCVENVNGASSMCKTVTFAEPVSNIPPIGNSHVMEPVIYNGDHAPYMPNDNVNEPFPLMIEMMCTNVENAVTFYGCCINRYEELQNLSLKLNSICPNLQRLLRKPALRKVYGALYEDMAWYRCSVVQCTIPTKPGLCIVQYIDYGNIAEVCYTNMVELPEPLKNLTPFAVKCVFLNLMCTPKSHNISYLHHLVNQRMSLCAFSPWGIPEYQVVKCSCNGIDVIGELVRNGFAIYRTRTSMQSPPVLNKPNRVTSIKSQENHKSKKANSTKTHKKAGNACSDKVRDACNDNRNTRDSCHDVIRSSSEINNNERVQDQGKVKKISSDESQQDFIPKKIIKRGSDITDVMNVPPLQGAKIVNNLLKVDCVISNLKLVNNIRSLFPLHTDDDLISNVINLLQNEINVSETNDNKKTVEESYQKYHDALNDLKECNNRELLTDLKKKREKQRIELLNELKRFFEVFDYSLLDKRKKIQEIITSLESNSNAWMNIYLSEPPKTLEELLLEYNQEKKKKKSVIMKARENTNEKHKKLKKFLEDLQKEFSLNTDDGSDVDETYFVNTEGKRGSWALKFEETLTEFGIALEEESNTSTMVKDKNHMSVINCILEKLDIPKEKIDAECELFEKYEALYKDLNRTTDLNPILEELYALQENIQTLSSNFVFNGDAEKMNNMLLKMHTALLKKDCLLQNLAKASASHFPELILEHPDLKLNEYKENSNLLKFSWDERFFPSYEKCNRIEPSYISKLADEFVVLKKFKISCTTDKKAYIKKAVAWNEIRSKSLVKIKAVFSNKDGNILYAVVPPVWETLYDKPLSVPINYEMALSILQQILVGLCDIHSRGIAHGSVHPLAVLHKHGEVLLDFNFDKKCLHNKFCLNGVNFQVPCSEDLYKSADMYGFGCLVLWVLFPNLSFSSTDQGVPNLSSFQSIIQELLSVKDFASLSALLNVNQDLRPSSRVLLSNGFLKDLRIMS